VDRKFVSRHVQKGITGAR